MEIKLKYGCNPNQSFARVTTEGDCPLTIRHGKPSYINILDGLRGWQLVRELKAATTKPAAASFKHVSPAGAAVAGNLSDTFRQSQFVTESDLSPLATAYAKARSSDRVASFGDFIAVSDTVDVSLARLIKPEVSDGIIAPNYEPQALEILQQKKAGGYVILQMDPAYQPPATESRRDFGLTLEQTYNDSIIDPSLLKNIVTHKKDIPADVVETLLVTTIAIKHTQSNSVALGYQGQAVGIGAGQQSRIACTRLACDKADRFFLKTHPKALALRYKAGLPRSEKVNVLDQFVRWHELGDLEKREVQNQLDSPVQPITADEREQWIRSFDGVVLSSDAFFPFRDNLDRAARSGVKYVIEAGGSKRDDDVIAAANEHNMVVAFSGLRLFLH
jgi:phosphoribosylaminoimidazolecarboxamide formyltransferase/IMP cyclohydrolase/phosphoribosylaminoimidazolecarboxamide formyltransferase